MIIMEFCSQGTLLDILLSEKEFTWDNLLRFASDIAAGRVNVNVMFDRLYQNSFPSGHTQIAFTVATVLLWAFALSGKLKWWGAVIIFCVASLIGVSRIYVGAHFPSDVLGGAVLGSGTAICCCWIAGKIIRRSL